jgi:DNA-binding XRE family transcriptional regulator
MGTTTKQVPNPTGKGGFGERPQDINPGGRPKNAESFTYWMGHFKNMGKQEFLKWEKENDNPTMAASLAYARVFKARNELKEFQEVANRTEGLPKASLELTGEIIVPIIIKRGTTPERDNTTPEAV